MATESAAVDNQNQGPTIVAACWVLFTIPAMMAGVRFWCKSKFSRGLGLDDLVLGVALVRFKRRWHLKSFTYGFLVYSLGLYSTHYQSRPNGSRWPTRVCY